MNKERAAKQKSVFKNPFVLALIAAVIVLAGV